jgi:mannan endo-1,6-alpha-mannosidase
MDGLMATLFSEFFPKQYGFNILSEVACETVKTCNRDQTIYKGLITGWLSTVSLLAPYTAGEIIPKLKASAVAAGLQCSGNGDSTCGITWFSPTWDGTSGIEQEMAALSVFANTLVAFPASSASSSSNYTAPAVPPPVTAATGGNSTSDPGAGGSGQVNYNPPQMTIGTGDRIGAALVTAVGGSAWIAIIVWLIGPGQL